MRYEFLKKTTGLIHFLLAAFVQIDLALAQGEDSIFEEAVTEGLLIRCFEKEGMKPRPFARFVVYSMYLSEREWASNDLSMPVPEGIVRCYQADEQGLVTIERPIYSSQIIGLDAKAGADVDRLAESMDLQFGGPQNYYICQFRPEGGGSLPIAPFSIRERRDDGEAIPILATTLRLPGRRGTLVIDHSPASKGARFLLAEGLSSRPIFREIAKNRIPEEPLILVVPPFGSIEIECVDTEGKLIRNSILNLKIEVVAARSDDHAAAFEAFHLAPTELSPRDGRVRCNVVGIGQRLRVTQGWSSLPTLRLREKVFDGPVTPGEHRLIRVVADLGGADSTGRSREAEKAIPPLYVRGRILDPKGQALPDEDIQYQSWTGKNDDPLTPNLASSQVTRSDPEGYFEIRDAGLSGPILVRARASGYPEAIFLVSDDCRNLILQLEEPATIQGRLRSVDGVDGSYFLASFTRSGEAEAEAHALQSDAEIVYRGRAGSFDLRIYSDLSPERLVYEKQGIEVAAGETIQLDEVIVEAPGRRLQVDVSAPSLDPEEWLYLACMDPETKTVLRFYQGPQEGRPAAFWIPQRPLIVEASMAGCASLRTLVSDDRALLALEDGIEFNVEVLGVDELPEGVSIHVGLSPSNRRDDRNGLSCRSRLNGAGNISCRSSQYGIFALRLILEFRVFGLGWSETIESLPGDIVVLLRPGMEQACFRVFANRKDIAKQVARALENAARQARRNEEANRKPGTALEQ